jgi:RNA polymerase sigma-70 factor, ECF subfamily
MRCSAIVLTSVPPRGTIDTVMTAPPIERDWPAPAGGDLDFTYLYSTHVGWVKAYFRRCGFSPADADDLAQEAFIRIFRSLHTFDPSRGRMSAWLATVVRNVARKRWHRRASTADALDPQMAEALLEAHATPAAEPETREELSALGGCVETLPPDLGRLIQLRYVDGMTTRAIADAAKLAEATVRLRLDEARAMLEKCLKSKGVWE